jgi:hypothetical protein
MAKIILTFENDGKTVHKKTVGFIGTDCVKMTKFIEDALGGIDGERQYTTEYYEQSKAEAKDRIKNSF